MYKFLLFFLLTLVSCYAQEKNENPPTKKEIIKLALSLESLPLSDYEFCQTNFADTTIGDYLSSCWEYHTNTDEINYLSVGEFETKHEKVKEDHWWVYMYICGRDKEWIHQCNWGIGFAILKSNRKVVKESIWCIGTP